MVVKPTMEGTYYNPLRVSKTYKAGNGWRPPLALRNPSRGRLFIAVSPNNRRDDWVSGGCNGRGKGKVPAYRLDLCLAIVLRTRNVIRPPPTRPGRGQPKGCQHNRPQDSERHTEKQVRGRFVKADRSACRMRRLLCLENRLGSRLYGGRLASGSISYDYPTRDRRENV